MTDVNCVRCGNRRSQLDAAPFRDDLGARILASVCQVCWDDWLKRQMQLINHYALDLRMPEARDFLRRNVQSFLFGEGAGDAIP